MIVIAGKNDIAIHGLFLALERFELDEIIVVVNKNDHGVDGWQRSLLKLAIEKGVKIKTLEEIYKTNINYFLSLEFDQIVKPNKLTTDKCYNIHFSILPKYKGMYTSVWPILYADREAGVTLHKIDHGIDTGDIVAQKTFKLNENDRSQDCYRKYIENSKILLSEWFNKIIENTIQPVKQDMINSTYFSAKTIDFKKLEIDFNKTAWQIKRQVYAFSFRPYQLLNFKNKKISDVIVMDEKSTFKPGTILHEGTDYTLLSTIDYNIAIFYEDLEGLLNEIPLIDVDSFSKKLVKTLGVNDRNSKGWSPIIVAAYHGRKDIISFLLENGANINDRNYHGTTVLMYAKDFALKNNDNAFLSFLIKKGADPFLKDWSDKTIYDYITPEQVELLGL